MRNPRVSGLWLGLPLLALCTIAGSTHAWGEGAGPAVALRTLALSRVEGTLVSLDAESLTLRSPLASAARTFRLEEVIAMDFGGRARADPKAPRFRAHLVGGTRLLGRYAGPAADGLVLDVAGLGRVTLLFEHVLTLEAWPADADLCRDVAGRHPRPPSDDVAYDTRGDQVRGTVTRATPEKLMLETERGRSLEVAWSDLMLLYLENDELQAPRGLQSEVEMADGSRLAVATLTSSDKGLRATLTELPDVVFTLPFEDVRTVRWHGGRFVYASDLPFESERTHYYEDPEGLLEAGDLERFFGTRVDRRLMGCPLRIGGESFRHGFAVYSHSRITLALEGAYASFRASFGIDDEVLAATADGQQRGNVDARVLGDGKVLWEAKEVRGGEKVRRLGPLDVRTVKTLVLEVGFGGDYYSFDRADWGDPILVKK